MPALFTLVGLLCLAGCEKSDYSGVSFKPRVEPADLYKTSVVVLVLRRRNINFTRGEGVTWAKTSPLGEGYAGLQDPKLTIDRSIAVPVVDFIGKAGGITPGRHALTFSVPGLARGEAPFKVQRDKMTLVFLEFVGRGKYRLWIQEFPHEFILTPLFRQMRKRAASVERYLSAYSDFLAGKSGEAAWPELFTDGYMDEDGGLDDLLLAHKYEVAENVSAVGSGIDSVIVTFGDKQAEVILGLADNEFQRLLIKPEGSGPGGWKAVSTGRDPTKHGSSY